MESIPNKARGKEGDRVVWAGASTNKRQTQQHDGFLFFYLPFLFRFTQVICPAEKRVLGINSVQRKYRVRCKCARCKADEHWNVLLRMHVWQDERVGSRGLFSLVVACESRGAVGQANLYLVKIDTKKVVLRTLQGITKTWTTQVNKRVKVG